MRKGQTEKEFVEQELGSLIELTLKLEDDLNNLLGE